MTKSTIYQALLLILLSFFTLSAFAWEHSIDLGYGYSHDPNHTKYNNSGFLLTSDVYTIGCTPMTHWSITGSLGRWHTTAPINKDLVTGAVSLAMRFYPFDIANNYPAYLLASFGPAYLSSKHFGLNNQAKQMTIQSNIGLGAEFDHFDLNLRFAHFSNANTERPNNGFNILYLLSLGYLF